MTKSIEELRTAAQATATIVQKATADADKAHMKLLTAVSKEFGASIKQVKALLTYADNGRRFAHLMDYRTAETLKRKGFVKHVHSDTMVRFSEWGGCSTNSWEELAEPGLAIVRAIRGPDWQYISPAMMVP